MEPVKIILDTDIGGDCDDTAALAILHELANEGKCELLAVTHCFRGPHYAGCIDAINRYYGRKDIPIGVFGPESDAPEGDDTYAEYAANNYPNRFSNGADCPDTVEVLRRTLSQADDGEVVIAVIGSLYSMHRLLESGPDEISSLSGKMLIEKKVARTVIMGGKFREYWNGAVLSPKGYVLDAEFNIRSAIPAAQAVCQNWPGELIFCSFEIGCKLRTCAGLQDKGSEKNPVVGCYRVWHEKMNVEESGRESWDPATVLFAVCPDMGLWKLQSWGQISVDGAGVTIWRQEEGGEHTFMVENASPEAARRAIDGILERDLERTKR